MAWLRVDDGFPENRKILSLPRRDRWTWLEILAYCARQQNGGNIPDNISDIIRHATPAFIAQAHNAGLLDRDDTGYTVHHWDEYNPKDPTNSVRQQRYRNAKRNAEVTENVTEENVTTVTPPRARVPSRPQPHIQEPSFLPTSTTDGKEGGTENGEHELPNLDTVLRSIP